MAKKPKAKENMAKKTETKNIRQKLLLELGQIIYDIGGKKQEIGKINTEIQGLQAEANRKATEIEKLKGD